MPVLWMESIPSLREVGLAPENKVGVLAEQAVQWHDHFARRACAGGSAGTLSLPFQGGKCTGAMMEP